MDEFHSLFKMPPNSPDPFEWERLSNWECYFEPISTSRWNVHNEIQNHMKLAWFQVLLQTPNSDQAPWKVHRPFQQI